MRHTCFAGVQFGDGQCSTARRGPPNTQTGGALNLELPPPNLGQRLDVQHPKTRPQAVVRGVLGPSALFFSPGKPKHKPGTITPGRKSLKGNKDES